jgi:hypothetical protein
MHAYQITDALRARSDAERRRDDPAQARQVYTKERHLVLCQDEITTSGRSISADGMVGAVNLDHGARAVVAPTFFARVARRNPTLAKHPCSFEEPRHLGAEQVVKVAARPAKAVGRFKPYPPGRQHSASLMGNRLARMNASVGGPSRSRS